MIAIHVVVSPLSEHGIRRRELDLFPRARGHLKAIKERIRFGTFSFAEEFPDFRDRTTHTLMTAKFIGGSLRRHPEIDLAFMIRSIYAHESRASENRRSVRVSKDSQFSPQ